MRVLCVALFLLYTDSDQFLTYRYHFARLHGLAMFGLWFMYGITCIAHFGLTAEIPFLTICLIPAALILFLSIRFSSIKAMI